MPILPNQTQSNTGVAKMQIELKDSVITIRHGYTDEVLVEFTAEAGDWNKLCLGLNRLVIKRGAFWQGVS